MTGADGQRSVREDRRPEDALGADERYSSTAELEALLQVGSGQKVTVYADFVTEKRKAAARTAASCASPATGAS
jgi:hypothetical protein